jgi:hypothetical protein
MFVNIGGMFLLRISDAPIKERRYNMVEYTYTFVTAQYKVKVRASDMNSAIEKFKQICSLEYIKVYRV